MEGRLLSRRGFSSMLSYLILAWSLFCFLGVWFLVFEYQILKGGLVAMIVTFFFATIIWAIPFSGLVLFHLYLRAPREASPGNPGLPEAAP